MKLHFSTEKFFNPQWQVKFFNEEKLKKGVPFCIVYRSLSRFFMHILRAVKIALWGVLGTKISASYSGKNPTSFGDSNTIVVKRVRNYFLLFCGLYLGLAFYRKILIMANMWKLLTASFTVGFFFQITLFKRTHCEKCKNASKKILEIFGFSNIFLSWFFLFPVSINPNVGHGNNSRDGGRRNEEKSLKTSGRWNYSFVGYTKSSQFQSYSPGDYVSLRGVIIWCTDAKRVLSEINHLEHWKSWTQWINGFTNHFIPFFHK